MQIEHKKNSAYYLAFPAVDDTTPASFKSGVSPADTAYYKDGAGAWTTLPITDTATEIGSTGVYEIDLTAAEMNHDQVVVKFAVAGMADTAFAFDMRTKLVDDLQDISTADVNTECDTALVDIGLDHLLSAAVIGTDVTDNSIVAKLVSSSATADWDDYVNTTDSLQAAVDNVGVSGAGLTALPAVDITASAVDLVWDEVLTAGTHNVVDSAGRRIRAIEESGGYEDGAVWIDTVNGTAGTTDYENGTVHNPVSTIADANTIATSIGISRFRVAPGSSLTFAATQSNQEFVGHEWTLALGGQNIAGTRIAGAAVTGTGTGAGYMLEGCALGTATLADGSILSSGLAGTLTASAAGDYYLDQCYSQVAGGGSWTFDFGAALGNTNLNIRHHSGGVAVNNKDATGTDLMSLEGFGQLVVAAGSSGAISLRGAWQVTNTGGATITYDETAADLTTLVDTRIPDTLSLANIESECNDALVAIHLDHLLAVDYDPATKPGAATALLNELIVDDAGDAQFSTNALENGPGGGVTVAAIADGVWDEAMADHLTVGSTGAQLNAAGGAGDPWITALPGAYAANTAGWLVGNGLAKSSPKTISPRRTWYLKEGDDSSVAENIVGMASGDIVTLAMDFSEVLNKGAGLSTVVSVTDDGAITTSNESVSQDKKQVHVDVTGAVSGETYNVTVTATTTDNHTIVGVGRITVD